MTLRFAVGAEEEHTNNAVGMGWASASGYTITNSAQGVNTGNQAYFLSLAHSGASQKSFHTGATKCWWTFCSTKFVRNNGTYIMMLNLLADSASNQRKIGWYYNTSDGKYYLRMFDGSNNTLVTSTNGTTAGKTHFKMEFDNDEWTLWSDINGGAWGVEWTYSDSTTPTYEFRMDLNFASDASKVTQAPMLDDCCLWDEDGDNWNTRGPVDSYANAFPRISGAHVPAAGRESDAGQGVKLDEIPPDAVDKATIAETDYFVQVDALDNGVAGPQDLTGETIQALLITHVAGDFGGAEDPEMSKFNVKRSGTLYADSEEYRVQLGASGSGSGTWWQTAGYYPWTPADENWTEAIFNACDYGISLISGETDQMTVQVIFFGTSHLWVSPGAPAALVARIYQVEQAINRSNTY